MIAIACIVMGCGDRYTKQQKEILDRETWGNYQNIGSLGIGFVPYHSAIHGYHRSLANTKDYDIKHSFVLMELISDLNFLDRKYDAKTVIIGKDTEVDNTPEIRSETKQAIQKKITLLLIIDPEDVYDVCSYYREKYGS